ncbi:unnamed protein product [Cochlearia groenlandica]
MPTPRRDIPPLASDLEDLTIESQLSKNSEITRQIWGLMATIRTMDWNNQPSSLETSLLWILPLDDSTQSSIFVADYLFDQWRISLLHHLPKSPSAFPCPIHTCSINSEPMASLNLVTSSNKTDAARINGGVRKLKIKKLVNVAEAQASQFAITMEGRVLNPDLQADKVNGLIGFMPAELARGDVNRHWCGPRHSPGGEPGRNKVRVTLSCEKALLFAMELEYDDEVLVVTIKYEKLKGFCGICHKMTHDDNHCPRRVVKPIQDRIVNGRSDWDRNDHRDENKDRQNRRYGDDIFNKNFNDFKGESSQTHEGRRAETPRNCPLQRQLPPEFTAAAEKRETRDWLKMTFQSTETKVMAPGERELWDDGDG